jgi:ketosteroid isomerase-like protein
VPSDGLQTLREGHTAFNRDDASWALTSVTEDVEWGTLGLFPGMEEIYRRPDGVIEWMRTVRAEWKEFEVELIDVMEENPTAAAVVERIWGRGRESGAEGEMTLYTVYRFSPEGRIAVREAYTGADEALAAL